MARKTKSMRAVLILSLILAVGGCSSARQALGLYQKTADKGVTVGSGRAEDGVAPPGSASGETNPAPARSRSANARAPKQNLPTGLAGDKVHRAYTTGTPN